MFFAELRFYFDDGGRADAGGAALRAANDWLGSLLRNGQLVDWSGVARTGPGELLAPVVLPAADSLDPRHDGRYVREARERLDAAGVQLPSLTLLGEDAEGPSVCGCAPSSLPSLVLFTTYLDAAPPVRCGACFGAVPLYRIPPTYNGDEYHDLLRWEADYQACDRLQMGCQTGERFGLREMSRLDSSLIRRGRAVCRTIEEKTGVPTYYHLFRWTGRSLAAERRRTCPGCGGAWLMSERWHDRFDFRCDPCRLLSNVAHSLAGR
jgi:predicted  nucleic acid-binding Zn ribbon protein